MQESSVKAHGVELFEEITGETCLERLKKSERLPMTTWYEENCPFYKVVRPIHAFKKTKDTDYVGWDPKCEQDIIVNLIIPVGAIVFVPEWADHSSKFRADKAFVYSQAHMNTGKVRYVSHSEWDGSFIYHSGQIVVPKSEFSYDHYECESGIHFFMSLEEAKDW